MRFVFPQCSLCKYKNKTLFQWGTYHVYLRFIEAIQCVLDAQTVPVDVVLSLWCWCWEWNYGKNVQWCAWAESTWLFVLVVVWGCLIVVLWFWKNTELLDWWNIPAIQPLRALNSLHVPSLHSLTLWLSAAPWSPVEKNTTQRRSPVPRGSLLLSVRAPETLENRLIMLVSRRV